MNETLPLKQSFKAAMPIILGYVAIGVPCGLLNASIGLGVIHVLILSILFYSGAGQFMLPNMYLAGSPIASIVASISLVNSRQMLYSASLARHSAKVKKSLAFIFAATVTDESFGVNIAKFEEGGWSVKNALFVNLFSQASWTVSNVIGVLVGNAIDIPLPIAAFAMTSIFICLMITQELCMPNVIAIVGAILGVIFCKVFGLTGPAILIGAVIGVASAFVYSKLVKGKGRNAAVDDESVSNCHQTMTLDECAATREPATHSLECVDGGDQ